MEISSEEWEEAMTHHSQALAHYNAGQFAEAISEWRAAVRIYPESPEMRQNLGAAFLKAGQLTDAIDHFCKALELKPDSPETLRNLGAAFMKAGQLTDGIDRFCKALELEPDNHGFLVDLAYARVDQWKQDRSCRTLAHEADRACAQALDVTPVSDSKLRSYLLVSQGKAKWAMGDRREGLRLAQEAVAAFRSREACDALIHMQFHTGRWWQAVRNARDYVNHPPALWRD